MIDGGDAKEAKLGRKRYRLAARRKDVGLSQERLAEIVEVDRSTVARWERADTDPQPWHRPRLARALKITLDELARLLAEVDGPATSVIPVRSAPAAPAAELDETDVDDVAVMTALRKADRQIGGGYLYASVTAHLQRKIGPRLFGQVPDNDLVSAFGAAAGLTEMAGWMAHDAGRDSVAERHLTRALMFAETSQDRHLAAQVCASLSHLAHDTRRPQLGMEYAHRGQVYLRSTAPHGGLEARLLAMQARGLAAQRDGTRCMDALRQAEHALTGEPPPSPWVSGFDEASLAAEAARCFTALDQPAAARQQAELVVELRPVDRPRSRALGQLMLASALVAQARGEEACVVARQALAATRGLSSYLVVRELDRLRPALVQLRGCPQVREFLNDLGGELRERQWLRTWVPAAESEW